jgi:hypothetical protein
VKVRTELPPTLKSVDHVNKSQILLEFTKALGKKSFNVNNFWLMPDTLPPLSVIRGKNDSQVLLSFFAGLKPGQYEVYYSNLVNKFNVPTSPDTLYFSFDVIEKMNRPYLLQVNILSKRELQLIFSESMEQMSSEDTKNYRIIPEDKITSAVRDEKQKNVIYLQLEGKNFIGSSEKKYYLEITDIRSIKGVKISNILGNRVLLFKEVVNLERLVVFPNPLRYDIHGNKITFGNIPQNSDIFIFSVNGKKITQLEKKNSGSIQWDLINDEGQLVTSGVYIFLVRYLDRQKLGKFVVIR